MAHAADGPPGPTVAASFPPPLGGAPLPAEGAVLVAARPPAVARTRRLVGLGPPPLEGERVHPASCSLKTSLGM
eukprot:4817930-Lingulodinium_polyedra.AAC.1